MEQRDPCTRRLAQQSAHVLNKTVGSIRLINGDKYPHGDLRARPPACAARPVMIAPSPVRPQYESAPVPMLPSHRKTTRPIMSESRQDWKSYHQTSAQDGTTPRERDPRS